MKQATIKEILNLNKKTLSGLHDSLGIDYNREHKLYKFSNIENGGKPVTINKIIKETGLTSKDFGIVLIKQPYNNEIKTIFKVIVINAYGEFNIHINDGWSLNTGIDNYFRKSDFEDDRKEDNFECFVFVVKKELLPFEWKDLKDYQTFYYLRYYQENLKEDFEGDNLLINRVYTIKPRTNTINTNRSASGIGDCYIYDKKKTFDYKVRYYYYNEVLTEEDLIDKSGYNVWLKRSSLKKRAVEIRANKNYNSLLKTSFDSDIKELADKINIAKNIIISKITLCDFASGDVYELSRKLNDLQYIYKSFEEHKKRIAEIGTEAQEGDWYAYKDIEAVTKRKNSIEENIKRLIA